MVYVKLSVCSKCGKKIVEGLLAQEGMKLKGKVECPYPQHYRPEVDVS
jgi:DNA-directed RNA polymerase subunit RPC12/RpoP